MKYKSFTDMDVWKKALELSIEVHKISSTLPRSEDYGLTSQIRRSSNSVNANIAEAFGRSTSPDKCRIYIFSRGSAHETQNHLIYGTQCGYFNKTESDNLVDRYDILVHDLNKIIRSLS